MASLTFRIQVTNGSGSYTLQGKGASLGGSYVDLYSNTGEPENGMFNFATLTVDGSQFVKGDTYTIRVVDDNTGFISGEQAFTIPSDMKLLETGDYKLLETGDFKLLEQ